MKIGNAVWTPRVNMLVIDCACGLKFEHRADRWRVTCPFCSRIGNLAKLREEFRCENERSAGNERFMA